MSPARLLAKSLTDPETRGEWKRDYKSFGPASGTFYENKRRKLKITSYISYGLYSSSSDISTPFTLTDAEKKIVREAMAQFDRHEQDEKEKDALARLVAPAIAIEAGTGETQSGSTAKPRKREPKASP